MAKSYSFRDIVLASMGGAGGDKDGPAKKPAAAPWFMSPWSNQDELDKMGAGGDEKGTAAPGVDPGVGSSPSVSFAGVLGLAAGAMDDAAKAKGRRDGAALTRRSYETDDQYKARQTDFDAGSKDDPESGGSFEGFGRKKNTYQRNDDGTESSSSVAAEIGSGGLHVGKSTATRGDGVDSSSGFGVVLGGLDALALTGRKKDVHARDAAGDVSRSTETSGSIGLGRMGVNQVKKDGETASSTGAMVTTDGLQLTAGKRNGDVESKGNLIVAGDKMGAGGSIGQDNGFNMGGSFAFGDSGYEVAANAGYGKFGAGISYKSMDDKQTSSFTPQEKDGPSGSLENELLGGATGSYGLMNGEAMGGSLSVSNGMLGAGINGGHQTSSAVSFSTTSAHILSDMKGDDEGLGGLSADMSFNDLAGQDTDLSKMDETKLATFAKDHPGLYRKWMARQYGSKVKGISDLSEIDAKAGMKVGEAYTLLGGEGWNAGVSATVGVTASLGISGQSSEKTTIAKTGEDEVTVEMQAMDASAVNAGVDAFGAAEIGLKDQDSEISSVRFKVKGEEGMAALAEYQETGLLPGADQITTDNKKLDEFKSARDTYRRMKADYDKAGEFEKSAKKLELDAFRSKMRDKAASINSEMMDGTWGLSNADIPGVEYESHKKMEREDESYKLSILGLGFLTWEWGSSHASWDEAYKQSGEDRTGYGSKHTENNVFSPDESTHVVLNPKDAFLKDREGKAHEIELAMMTDQSMNKKQRESVSKLPGMGGVEPEHMKAWVDGKWKDNDTTQVRLAFTEAHFDVLQKATTRDDTFWSDASNKLTPFVARMHDQQTQTDSERFSFAPAFSPGAGLKKIEDMTFVDAAGDVLTPVLKEMGIDVKGPNGYRSMAAGEEDAVKKLEKKLASVSSPEQFAALTEKEQTLFLTSYAMQAIEDKGDPWRAMTMAMQVKDKDVRNRHMRKLFHVIEKRKQDTHAMMDFISHIQNAPYLTDDERTALLSAVQVNLKDGRVDRREKEILGKPGDVDKGQFIADKMKKDSETLRADDPYAAMGRGYGMSGNSGMGQILKGKSADDTVDWLQAARKAGGATLVSSVASKLGTEMLDDILIETSHVHKARARVLLGLLVETSTHKKYAEARLKILDENDGEMSYWDSALQDLPGETEPG